MDIKSACSDCTFSDSVSTTVSREASVVTARFWTLLRSPPPPALATPTTMRSRKAEVNRTVVEAMLKLSSFGSITLVKKNAHFNLVNNTNTYPVCQWKHLSEATNWYYSTQMKEIQKCSPRFRTLAVKFVSIVSSFRLERRTKRKWDERDEEDWDRNKFLKIQR